MPLETAEFISQLNPTWPLGSDFKNQGDDHLRTTKKAVQQSFPNVDAEVSATAAQLNQLAVPGAVVPTGTVLAYAADTPPNGYLVCDGAAIDAEFTDLIALIGANTPDLRGQFLRGTSDDNAVDPDGPRLALTSQAQAVGPHSHTFRAQIAIPNYTGSGNPPDNRSIDTPTAETEQTGTGIGAETRPVNIAMLYIIKT